MKPKKQAYSLQGAVEEYPLPYSPALRVGEWVFVAGQGPLDPKTRQVRHGSIEEETRLTLENVRALLEAAGAGMADVVKTTVHLSDLSLFDRFNAVYREFFPTPRPVRTTVQSGLIGGIQVEVDVMAYCPAAEAD